jgi:trans-aconitate methyltransferase
MEDQMNKHSTERLGSSAAHHADSALQYPGFVCPETNLSHLEVAGRLHGMSPAPASCARALEVGCGDGTNLLSLAQIHPSATLLGLDRDADAIARANWVADRAGLTNVGFRLGDLTDFKANEAFDYVIADGVYSWIPKSARDALLALCASSLAPQGIVFISYNAYPGSHLFEMVSGALRQHLIGVTSSAERLARAHQLMQILASHGEETPYARAMQNQVRRMLADAQMQSAVDLPDLSLLHNHLAPTNTPVYFREFLEHARSQGLQFLANGDLRDSRLAATVRDALPEGPIGRAETEQYADFFANTSFRQTLLCRDAVALTDSDRPETLEALYYSADLRLAADGDTFVASSGASVRPVLPHVQAILNRLMVSWPQAVGFETLAALPDADGAPRADQETRRREVHAFIIRAFQSRLVEAKSQPDPLWVDQWPCPIVSSLARAQLAAGRTVVSSLSHRNVNVGDAMEREVLARCDGSVDQAKLHATTQATPEDLSAMLLTAARAGLLSEPPGTAAQDGSQPSSQSGKARRDRGGTR